MEIDCHKFLITQVTGVLEVEAADFFFQSKLSFEMKVLTVVHLVDLSKNERVKPKDQK